MAKAEITLDASGCGSLVLDGKDISSSVSGLTLTTRPGRGAQLVLDLAHVDVTVDADAAVDLPEDVKATLTALGWTSPNTWDKKG